MTRVRIYVINIIELYEKKKRGRQAFSNPISMKYRACTKEAVSRIRHV